MCHTVGVVYCKENQKSEEEMLGNSQGSQNFDHFLHMLGNIIKLQGFKGYKGDLDIKSKRITIYGK